MGDRLIHEAKSSGRWVYLITYVEGGVTPIKANVLFRTAADAARFAEAVRAIPATGSVPGAGEDPR